MGNGSNPGRTEFDRRSTAMCLCQNEPNKYCVFSKATMFLRIAERLPFGNTQKHSSFAENTILVGFVLAKTHCSRPAVELCPPRVRAITHSSGPCRSIISYCDI